MLLDQAAKAEALVIPHPLLSDTLTQLISCKLHCACQQGRDSIAQERIIPQRPPLACPCHVPPMP